MELGEKAGLAVLIVERHRTVAESLGAIVSELGNVEIVARVEGEANALESTGKLRPDVVLIDVEMCADDDLIGALHASSPETRVIVMADRLSTDAGRLVDVLARGAVGAIYKEASLEELRRAVAHSSTTTPVVADEAAGLLLGAYVDALTDKRHRDLAVIETLAGAMEVRDMTTGRHLHRVTEIARECVDRVDPDLALNEEVAFGFTLHDIGKIGIPDAVLNKPGPLDTQEWDLMRRHPEMGVKIVQPIGFGPLATDIILWHHERWDGRGYPSRLRGDEIPITARVFAVADAFDAMTTDRPYRPAMPTERALGIIAGEAHRAFDPDVVEVFLDLTDAGGRR